MTMRRWKCSWVRREPARRPRSPRSPRRSAHAEDRSWAFSPPTFATDGAVTEQDEALRALRAWYRDWSETARAVIRRRDHLLMLGLSQRKSTRGDDEEGEGTDEPEPPTTNGAAQPAEADFEGR